MYLPHLSLQHAVAFSLLEQLKNIHNLKFHRIQNEVFDSKKLVKQVWQGKGVDRVLEAV